MENVQMNVAANEAAVKEEMKVPANNIDIFGGFSNVKAALIGGTTALVLNGIGAAATNQFNKSAAIQIAAGVVGGAAGAAGINQATKKFMPRNLAVLNAINGGIIGGVMGSSIACAAINTVAQFTKKEDDIFEQEEVALPEVTENFPA